MFSSAAWQEELRPMFLGEVTFCAMRRAGHSSKGGCVAGVECRSFSPIKQYIAFRLDVSLPPQG
jgi:hypothetical protein